MKFLHVITKKFFVADHNEKFINHYNELYGLYNYTKLNIKKRKILLKIRPKRSKSKSKNSIYRDVNNSFIQQYININQKNGNKLKIQKCINLTLENLNSIFLQELEEFQKYNLYSDWVYLFNNDPQYSNINYIIESFIFDFKSIFEIKTIKNNKKKKNSTEKYSHEIAYIPVERRLKYVLKALTIYKESFKNYNLWERIFWSFLITIINKNNSFLKKRREFIYIKSIKFFKKKNKVKKL